MKEKERDEKIVKLCDLRNTPYICVLCLDIGCWYRCCTAEWQEWRGAVREKINKFDLHVPDLHGWWKIANQI